MDNFNSTKNEQNMSVVPFPEDEYLIKLGKVIYSMSYHEWSIMGDLLYIIGNDKIPGVEIARQEVRNLFSKTSGQIAEFFRQKSAVVSDNDLKKWLKAAGDAIETIDKRNDVIHSHPITNKAGKQRLYRNKKHFEISDDFLDDTISELSDLCSDVGNLRLLFNKIAVP